RLFPYTTLFRSPRVEDVGHMGCHVFEPRLLVRAHEISAHEADLSTNTLDVRVELSVFRLDLRGCQLRRVRLVLQCDPAQLRHVATLDEVDQHVGELLDRAASRIETSALPRDVDRRPGALRKQDGSYKRLHAIGIGERGRMEEDPRELWMQRAHLLFHHADVVVSHTDAPAERRVDVMIELAAVSGEAWHDD